MAGLKGTGKLHGIEYNSPDNPFKYSEKGWQFKRNYEKYKKKYSSFYYESAKDADGNTIYIRHPNQG